MSVSSGCLSVTAGLGKFLNCSTSYRFKNSQSSGSCFTAPERTMEAFRQTVIHGFAFHTLIHGFAFHTVIHGFAFPSLNYRHLPLLHTLPAEV